MSLFVSVLNIKKEIHSFLVTANAVELMWNRHTSFSDYSLQP